MSKEDRVATTLRLSRKKLQLLKVVAALQNKKVNEILNELIDQYLAQNEGLLKGLEKNKNRKKLKEKWKKIKEKSLRLDDWKSLEGSLYDEMSSGH